MFFFVDLQGYISYLPIKGGMIDVMQITPPYII